MIEFPGSVAVVTGGASGIGRAAALAFAREGADVVVADRNGEGARAVAGEVEALGRRALWVRADVGRREEVEALVDRAVEWQGHCDLFFSNAGVAVSGPPHRIPLEDWEWIVAVNLWAHVWAVRRVLPHMLERGSGHLVHTASAAGLVGAPQIAPYVVTKFAVVGLCESLAMYCRPRGVGVSVVCPMFVATNIMEGARNTPEEGEDERATAQRMAFARQLIQQAGIPPERVAEAVVQAVREDRLYVFPHPELHAIVTAKWQDPEAWVRSAAEAVAAGDRIFG